MAYRWWKCSIYTYFLFVYKILLSEYNLRQFTKKSFQLYDEAGIIQTLRSLNFFLMFGHKTKLIKALKLLNERHKCYENFQLKFIFVNF